MLDGLPIPAVEAEPNLPTGNGDGGAGDLVRDSGDTAEISVLRIEEHRARLEETKADRAKLGWAYRALAAGAYQEHVRHQAEVEQHERELRPLLDLVHQLGGMDSLDGHSELAARILGVENRIARAEKAAKRALAERDRHQKSAESVVSCMEGLLVGRANGDDCTWHGVGGCNRIGCPHCSAKRASVEVAEYAPRLADLTDCQVWMLSARNVAEGQLAEGCDALTKAFGKLTRTKWFKDRFNAGVRSLEVTVGKPPKEIQSESEKRSSRGWHPHLHVIVGNLSRPMDWTHPDGEWDQRDIGRLKRRLQKAWRKALGVDYEPVVWIDRPHYVAQGRKFYADDLGEGDPNRMRALEHAAREALKYIVKGVSEIPRGLLPELLQAKEGRRWMQTFGELHEQGVRHCPKCAARWRLREKGPSCPACGERGRKASELEEEEPWCCTHGHTFVLDGYVKPPWEEWVKLNPAGLLVRRKKRSTGPPAPPGLKLGRGP